MQNINTEQNKQKEGERGYGKFLCLLILYNQNRDYRGTDGEPSMYTSLQENIASNWLLKS